MDTNNKPAVRSNSIVDILKSDDMKARFADVLPSILTPERMVRVALVAINKTPKLADCTKESLMQCLMDCASLGLEPDGRRAHLIPYGNKATLIIDYKGLIELAKRSGEVILWRPVAVHANDKFAWCNGIVEHEIDFMADRGELRLVYSYVLTKDRIEDYEVMTVAECEAIRKRSKAGSSGPWVTDFESMCLKSVMRKHSKRLTLSPEFREALDKDADRFDDIEPKQVSGASFVRSYRRPESAPPADGPQPDDSIFDLAAPEAEGEPQ